MRIDLNADLGEGFGPWTMGDDAALLDIVSSANIACGFHAGDPAIMDRTVRVALARDVEVGAHVGFPDRQGFGRRPCRSSRRNWRRRSPTSSAHWLALPAPPGTG